MPPTVDAVALIIVKGDSVLVEWRRLDETTALGKVVIPGGHVDTCENHVEVCRRKPREVRGIECTEFTFYTKVLCPTGKENRLTTDTSTETGLAHRNPLKPRKYST